MELSLSAVAAGVVLQAVRLPGGGEIDPVVGLGGGAVGAFLSTVLVGAVMVALAPAYVERMMERVVDDAVGSFVYGLLWVVLTALVVFALVVSLIGILVVPIVVLVVTVVWAIGAVIAFLAIADRLLDTRDGWLKPLLVAGLINGGLTLTGIGGLVAFCIGAAGFGAILRDRWG